MNFFLGLFIVLAGIWVVWKSEWIYRNFGGSAWAEKYLGTEGGSRLFYKLIGLAIIFLGFCVMTGLWYDLLSAIFGMFGLGAKR